MIEADPPHPITRHPDGWFAVALSDDLRPGDVRPLRSMGVERVVFRTASGDAHVLDAHCAHLGAHLGHGGRVEGESLVCPFHGWRWGGAGRCVEVPYAKRMPERARMRAWPVRERNGVILAWHHHAGAGPFFEMPEIASEGWTPTRWVHLELPMHILEIAENGIDTAHFRILHGCDRALATLVDPHGIPFRLDLETAYAGDGIGIPGQRVEVTTEWSFFGPGIFLGVSTADRFGMRVRQLFHFTPEPGGRVHFRIGIALDTRTIPADAIDFVLEQNVRIARQNLLEDAPIWQHKRHWSRPVLCDGDGPFGVLRAWLARFFPGLAPGID